MAKVSGQVIKVALVKVSKYNNKVISIDIVDARENTQFITVGKDRFSKVNSEHWPALLARRGINDIYNAPEYLYTVDSEYVKEHLEKLYVEKMIAQITKTLEAGTTREKVDAIASILDIHQ